MANAVISRNVHRTPKTLRTNRGPGLEIVVHEAYDEADEAAFVVNTIQKLVARGEAKLGDCAVMYRTNAQSRALEDAFVARGIPYRLVGGTRFYQRKEIKDTLAYLRLVHNPADNLSLMRIINVPPRNIGEKTVAALAAWSTELGLPMAAGLALVAGDLASPFLPVGSANQSEKPPQHPFSAGAQRSLTAFYHMLKGWHAVKDNLAVADLLTRITEQAGYATWLRDGTEEGEDRWANLQELCSVAAHYNDFPPELRLTAFLEEVALVSDQDELTEEHDRATLLTLHTAKGLEFGVVFIVGLEENILPHSRSLEDPDQLEEERRLMYVGVTRAKDRLYLVRAFRRTIWGRSEVNEPSRFLRDIAFMVKGAAAHGGRRNGERALIPDEDETPARRSSTTERWSSVAEGIGSRPTPTSAGQPLTGSSAPATRPAIAGRAMTTARPAAEPTAGRLQFKPGERVAHSLFGEGIVLKVEPTADNDEEITVAFAGKGTKTLLASFAKLQKIA